MTVATLERPAVATAAPARSSQQKPPATAVGMPIEAVDFVYPRLEQALAIVVLLETTIENDQAPAQHFAELFSRCVEMALRQVQQVTTFDAASSTSTATDPAYDWVDEAYELTALFTVMSAGLHSGGESFDAEEVVVANLLAAARCALKSIMSSVGASRA